MLYEYRWLIFFCDIITVINKKEFVMNQSVMLNIPEETSHLLTSAKDTNVVLMLGWKWFLFPVFVQAKILSSKPKAYLLEQAEQETHECKKIISAIAHDNLRTNTELSTLRFAFDQFQEKRELIYRYEKDSTFLQRLISLVGSDLILAKIVNRYVSDSHVPDSEKQDAQATSDKQNQSECHNKPTTPNHSQ